jgi:hypothetical protein
MGCKMIYRLWRWKIVKQNESDGDLKFIATIVLREKSSSHWKINKKSSWKWKGVCWAYKNPILDFNVGQMSSKNRRKTCKAHVIFTTRGGMAWSMN